MAKTQYSYVQHKTAEAGQTGTATYDLPERDYLDEILLTAWSTPTAVTHPALPLTDAITKVQVIDGGTVIKSLTGNQARALQMIHGDNCLAGEDWAKNAVEGWTTFRIPLGGILDGNKFAPDMSVFSNPQIKITWDYSITTTEFGMSCDADAAPAMKFSVLAKMLRDGAPVTHGYLRSQQIYEFTQSASSTTVTEIPRKYPIVGIGIEAGYDNKDFADDVEEVKLDFDNGSWIPFHFYEGEIGSIQQAWFNNCFKYSWLAEMIDAEELDTHMGILSHLGARATSAAGRSVEYEAGNQGVDTLSLFDVNVPTAIAAYEAIYFEATGWMPFHMWYMPAKALTGEGKETLLSTDYGRIEIETTSGAAASASSTPAIILEELVT